MSQNTNTTATATATATAMTQPSQVKPKRKYCKKTKPLKIVEPKSPELVSDEDLADESSPEIPQNSATEDSAESSTENDENSATEEDSAESSTEEDESMKEPVGKEYKNLTKLGATKGELAVALSKKEFHAQNCDQRTMDILIAHKQDQTTKGERTERCSFQVKLQVSKMMLKTIQHHLKPEEGGSYTDVALKEAFNLYFYKQWNEFMSRELVENFQHIYSNKKGEADKITSTLIDVPENYFEETFMNGFLTTPEAVAVMEEKQRLHNRQLNQKRKAKSKIQSKADAKKDFADMTKEEQDAFLADLMAMKKE